MSEGYFLIANGLAYCERIKKYAIPSIRLFDPVRPITILTDRPMDFVGMGLRIMECRSKEWCAQFGFPTTPAYTSEFFMKGTLPKLIMFSLTPYEHTMFIDEDVVCLKDINAFWKECKNQCSPLICSGEADASNKGPSSWHWGHIDTVAGKCGFPIPQISSGMVYWRNSALMWTCILKYLRSPTEYMIRPSFRGTYPDEIFLAIYMGLTKIRPVPYKGYHEVNEGLYSASNAYFMHVPSKNTDIMNAYFNDAKRRAAPVTTPVQLLERQASAPTPAPAPAQSLAGFYQCHKNPKNFLGCMESFRTYYPGASVVVISDGGYNYKDYCKKYGYDYTYVTKEQDMAKPLAYTSREAVLNYFERLWTAFAKMRETHCILLEDDVRIIRRHTSTFRYSINGCNYNVRLPDCIIEKLKEKQYTGPYFYGGCGGCVLDKTFFASIPFASVRKLLEETALTEFHTDQLFTFIALYFGGTIGQYAEFAEMHLRGPERLAAGTVAFLHQYKVDYGKEPTPEENAMLGFYAPVVEGPHATAASTALQTTLA